MQQENITLKSLVAENAKRTDVLRELKNAEESLRDSEERYRIISSLTTDYIFRLRVEEDGRIITDLISENYPAITKRTIEDISTPDLWLKIIHDEDRPRLEASLSSLITEGGSADLECRSYLPDGR